MSPDPKNVKELKASLVDKLRKEKMPEVVLKELDKRIKLALKPVRKAKEKIKMNAVQEAFEAFNYRGWLKENHSELFTEWEKAAAGLVQAAEKEAGPDAVAKADAEGAPEATEGLDADAEAEDQPKGDPRLVAQIEKLDKQKAAAGREKTMNDGDRELRKELRDIRIKWLNDKKTHYENLANASPSERENILKAINTGEEQCAYNRLAVYKRLDEETLTDKQKAEMARLERIAHPEKFKDEEKKETSLTDKAYLEIVGRMEKAVDKGFRINNVEFKDFENQPGKELNDLAVGANSIKANFDVLAKAQAEAGQVASHLGTALGGVMQGLAKASKTRQSSGVVDWASSKLPNSWTWLKTDAANAVNTANTALKAAKAKLKDSYNPQIETVIDFQIKILGAAKHIAVQAEDLENEAKEDKRKSNEDKEASKKAVDAQGKAAKEKQTADYNKDMESLKQEKGKRLEELAKKRNTVKEAAEGKEAALKEWNEKLQKDKDVLNTKGHAHEAARMNLGAQISTLEKMLAEKVDGSYKLPEVKRQAILVLINTLKGNELGLEALNARNVDLVAQKTSIEEAQKSLDENGVAAKQKMLAAYTNLVNVENSVLVSFSDAMKRRTDTFVLDKGLTDSVVEQQKQMIDLEYDIYGIKFDELAEQGIDLKGRADENVLNIEINNMSTKQNLEGQKKQIESVDKAELTFVTSLYNTVSLKFAMPYLANFLDVDEDSWMRKEGVGIFTPVEKLWEGIEEMVGSLGLGAAYDGWVQSVKDSDHWFAKFFGEGFVAMTDFVKELGGAVYNFVAHPIDTVDGLAQLLTAPLFDGNIKKWKEVGAAIFEVDEYGQGNVVYAITKTIANVALLFATRGAGSGASAAGAAGRAARAAEVAGQASNIGKAATAAEAANAAKAVLEAAKQVGVSESMLSVAVKQNIVKAGATMDDLLTAVGRMSIQNKTAELAALSKALGNGLSKMPAIAKAGEYGKLATFFRGTGGALKEFPRNMLNGIKYPFVTTWRLLGNLLKVATASNNGGLRAVIETMRKNAGQARIKDLKAEKLFVEQRLEVLLPAASRLDFSVVSTVKGAGIMAVESPYLRTLLRRRNTLIDDIARVERMVAGTTASARFAARATQLEGLAASAKGARKGLLEARAIRAKGWANFFKGWEGRVNFVNQLRTKTGVKWMFELPFAGKVLHLPVTALWNAQRAMYAITIEGFGIARTMPRTFWVKNAKDLQGAVKLAFVKQVHDEVGFVPLDLPALTAMEDKNLEEFEKPFLAENLNAAKRAAEKAPGDTEGGDENPEPVSPDKVQEIIDDYESGAFDDDGFSD